MNKLHAYTRKIGSQKEVPILTKLNNQIYMVDGYQGYRLSPSKFTYLSYIHYLKYQTIRPYLVLYSRDKKIIDIGCSAGAVGIQCIFDHFENVNFLDHDSEYIEIIDDCLKHIGAESAKTHISKVGEFREVFEVGFAFALIHWIYSYSEKNGNLDSAVNVLYKISPDTLFIEWVDSKDPAIKDAQHLSQNPDIVTDAYTKENFLIALKSRYKLVKKIGRVSGTREIWYASNSPVFPTWYSKKVASLNIIFSKIYHKILKKINKLKKIIN